jgi:hypothetical protein
MLKRYLKKGKGNHMYSVSKKSLNIVTTFMNLDLLSS